MSDIPEINFPAYNPTNRRYVHGDWPIKRHKFMRNTEQRLLCATAKVGQELRLSYANQPTEVIQAFFNHYDSVYGQGNSFKLPKETLAGWKGKTELMGFKQLWHYKTEPRVTSNRGLISTLEITLVVATDKFIVPTPEPQPPTPNGPKPGNGSSTGIKFPSFHPSARSYSLGDWNVKAAGLGLSGQKAMMNLPSTAIKSDTELQLTFANRSDSVAEAILEHYHDYTGSYQHFNLPIEIFKDWTKNLGNGNWIYAAPPQVVTSHPGTSTTTVRLINTLPSKLCATSDAFPTNKPTDRRYTHGAWPTSNHRFMTGHQQRMLHATKKIEQELKLTYANLKLSEIDNFINHYNTTQGTFVAFQLPLEVFYSGWKKKKGDGTLFADGHYWRYKDQPRISSRRGGLGTLEVVLVTSSAANVGNKACANGPNTGEDNSNTCANGPNTGGDNSNAVNVTDKDGKGVDVPSKPVDGPKPEPDPGNGTPIPGLGTPNPDPGTPNPGPGDPAPEPEPKPGVGIRSSLSLGYNRVVVEWDRQNCFGGTADTDGLLRPGLTYNTNSAPQKVALTFEDVTILDYEFKGTSAWNWIFASQCVNQEGNPNGTARYEPGERLTIISITYIDHTDGDKEKTYTYDTPYGKRQEDSANLKKIQTVFAYVYKFKLLSADIEIINRSSLTADGVRTIGAAQIEAEGFAGGGPYA